MPALVVFDCFGTVVTELTPMPEAPELARRLAAALGLPSATAAAVIDDLIGTLWTALTDPAAEQPASRELLARVLDEHGVPADAAAVDRTLWHVMGPDDGRFRLCAPAAEAMVRTAAAGHTVRMVSTCYLPGDQMRRLLAGLGVPDVLDACLFSADGGPKKPDPRAFAAVGAGDFTRRVMVGDTPHNDIAPARELGWDTVQVDAAAPDFTPLHALLGI